MLSKSGLIFAMTSASTDPKADRKLTAACPPEKISAGLCGEFEEQLLPIRSCVCGKNVENFLFGERHPRRWPIQRACSNSCGTKNWILLHCLYSGSCGREVRLVVRVVIPSGGFVSRELHQRRPMRRVDPSLREALRECGGRVALCPRPCPRKRTGSGASISSASARSATDLTTANLCVRPRSRTSVCFSRAAA